MNNLIIIAHGSRREQSNQEVTHLARSVAASPRSRFNEVSVAFLEIASPSIDEALEENIKKGAQEITLFPYFLAAGRHVAEDIPNAIAPAVQRHPDVLISITPHLGSSALIPSIILNTTTDI